MSFMPLPLKIRPPMMLPAGCYSLRRRCTRARAHGIAAALWFASVLPLSAQLVDEAKLLNPRTVRDSLANGYPIRWVQAGVGGTVALRVFVDSIGRPDTVRVTSSSGVVDLDRTARAALYRARYAPAIGPNGRYASWLDAELVFGQPSSPDVPRLADRAAMIELLQAHAPADLRQQGINTDVVVSLRIDSAGSVVHSEMPHPGCFPSAAGAALAATRQFVFEPADSGAPRATLVTVQFDGDSVRFRLRGDADPPPRPTPPVDSATRVQTSRPVLRNALEVQRALVRAYPRALRERGVSGDVTLWLLVGEDGRVRRRKVLASDGTCDFDLAALEVARSMRFEPARRDGERVTVWVEIPISFTVRPGG